MKYLHELVTVEGDIPVKIIIHNKFTEYIPSHWHKSLEITFITDGEFSCYINGKYINVKKEELLLINSGEIHSIYINNEETVSGLTLMFPYNFLKYNYGNIDDIEFKINNNKLLENHIKELFINIIDRDTSMNKNNKVNNLNQEFYYLKVKSILYEILYVLFANFSVEKDTKTTIKSEKYIDRFKKITEYINKNYQNNMLVQDVADYYGLSREHLSRCFKKYMGITFGQYLNSIRLYNAYRDLVNTDYSITRIAFDNGFANVASFINKFKEMYGQTPYNYKKYLKQNNNKIKNNLE